MTLSLRIINKKTRNNLHLPVAIFQQCTRGISQK